MSRPKVFSHVSGTLHGRALRAWVVTWSEHPIGLPSFISPTEIFPTWREAMDFANKKAQEQ